MGILSEMKTEGDVHFLVEIREGLEQKWRK
jgi:hypothetical protein